MSWLRLYYPFEIDSTNDGVAVTVGASTYAFDVPAGTYYAIGEDLDGRSGFFNAFLAALNAAATGTETWSLETYTDVLPYGTSMAGLSRRKVRIKNDEGLAFQVDWSASELPPELLGWDPSRSTAAPASAGHPVESPYCFWGAWQPRTLFSGDHLPRDTTPSWRADVRSSRPREPDKGAHYKWGSEKKTREVTAEAVAAAHLFPGYSGRRAYARVAGVDPDEPNNALVDVWRNVRLGEEFLALWDAGDTKVDQISALGSDAYDWCVLDSGDHQSGFGPWHSRDSDLGDWHSVRIPVVVTGGSYA